LRKPLLSVYLRVMDSVKRLTELPVLSVRQPWASYLVSGFKTLELRSWSTGYRGWLWIHTGKKPDRDAMESLDLDGDEFHCGGLVGLAEFDDCILLDTQSSWIRHRGEHLSPGYFNGTCYGWHFSDALSLPEIIQCPGELGLFQLSATLREQVYEAIVNSDHQEFIKDAPDLVELSRGKSD
jgi:hypothetical protein